MKAIMIIIDQAHYVSVLEKLNDLEIRGFTAWKDVKGCGSETGEPHFGSHAWPSVNNAILTVVEDSKVEPTMKVLKDIDNESQNLGLRAFVWNIESMI